MKKSEKEIDESLADIEALEADKKTLKELQERIQKRNESTKTLRKAANQLKFEFGGAVFIALKNSGIEPVKLGKEDKDKLLNMLSGLRLKSGFPTQPAG